MASTGTEKKTAEKKKVERPVCKRLMDVMEVNLDKKGQTNWTAVGREFNTSAKTAHIWAEQYGLIPVKFYLGKVFY